MSAQGWGAILAHRPAEPSILWVLRTYGFTEGKPCHCTDYRCGGRTLPSTGRRQADGTWVEFCRGGTVQVWHDHTLDQVHNAVDFERQVVLVLRAE